jgi:dienelactone hydrolase
MVLHCIRGAVVALALGICAPASAVTEGATVPRIADLVAPPAIEESMLSPDGARVAARALIDGEPRLALYDAAHPEAGPVPIALPPGARLEWYRWIDRSHLVASLVDRSATRLIAIDVVRGTRRSIGAARNASMGDTILHIDRGGAFLLLQRRPDPDSPPSVHRVDLATGAMRLEIAAQPHVWDWVVDSAGVVRAGMAEQGGRAWLLYRSKEREGFARGAEQGVRPISRYVPVNGSDLGYALADDAAGRVALYRYDFHRRRLGALVYAHPSVDLEEFETAPDGTLLGVGFSADRRTMHWFDRAMAAQQAALDAALPGRANRVVSASTDKARLLVFSESASDPGAFYFFERGEVRLLSAVSPALAKAPAPQVRAVRYAARDGLTIPGFLTLPAGRAAKDLPLVVMPHGGPFARDDWGYDPWVRYLADKGYAVLQPNYRGSTGFGRAFIEKGDGQWGRGMQDDVDDGVAWLAGQGIADPKRVCIMGASYGGYAAMWAATGPSRRYRCAISFAGIADVQAQLDYDHQSFEERDYRAWKRRIQGKAPSLAALSPLTRIETLTVPILIAHGSADETVPVAQARMLHDALARRGRAHAFKVYEGEGHSLSDPANTADFLARVGAFLDAHNPAG